MTDYLFYVVWSGIVLMVLFSLLMSWYTKRPQDKKLILPFAGVFIVLDVLYNWLLTPLFLDLPLYPRETISERVARYAYDDDLGVLSKWKRLFGTFICKELHKHDPNHCKHNLHRVR